MKKFADCRIEIPRYSTVGVLSVSQNQRILVYHPGVSFSRDAADHNPQESVFGGRYYVKILKRKKNPMKKIKCWMIKKTNKQVNQIKKNRYKIRGQMFEHIYMTSFYIGYF